jgi:hypothetical protein
MKKRKKKLFSFLLQYIPPVILIISHDPQSRALSHLAPFTPAELKE